MKSYHYLNGDWIEGENLKISVFDLTVHRGYGIFEFIRTYNSKLFRANDYLERFYNSAEYMNLEIPFSKKKITVLMEIGIKKNNFDETNIKIILTGGIPKGELVKPRGPSLVMIFSPSYKYCSVIYKNGITAITVLSTKLYPQIKTINQIAAIRALLAAKKRGADEAILIDSVGRMSEGTRSNFFAVKDGLLMTSKNGVLLGITRKVVLELTKKVGLPARETDINIKDLRNFSECFITATDKGIVPVIKINDKTVGNGKVGAITKRIMKAFKMLASST